MDRIATFREILTQDPNNAFARYGLAMELAGQGDNDGALTEFGQTIERNPDYVPAYQMSAQTLLKAGRTAEAIDRLKAGLEAAQRTGNTHALSEMQGMLSDIG